MSQQRDLRVRYPNHGCLRDLKQRMRLVINAHFIYSGVRPRAWMISSFAWV